MNGDVLFERTENCLTMAAGSDPQPVESSVVPNHNKPSLISVNSLEKISGVRNHIPYSDHNYGKPLTPPDSCSPEHPEEADTGNEEEGFTRCICGYKHDDGYMICCDKCSAWQHVECVLGVKSNSVPETYLCDECDPRPLDKERAKQIQTKKIEEPTDEEEEEDGDVSDHDSDHGLTRVPLPNPVSIKENILTKGKRKKRDSARKLGQKEIKHNKRKRRKRKHISTDAIPVDEETNGPWSSSAFPGRFNHESYQEAHKTLYDGELSKQTLLMPESQVNLPGLLKPEQLCKVVEVQKNRKGVVVTEDTSGEQFIIECKGILMLESKFKEDNRLFAKCYPYALYYTKLDHLRLVMNFERYGNDARFIRRSCSPTAEVRHVIVENQIHLVVVSVTPLAKGSEVTVAFEFPFLEYSRPLDCACAQDSCRVLKHNLAQNLQMRNGYRNKDDHGLALMESSLSNHMDSDSEGDNSNDAKDKRSRKKPSREERKLQQLVRQIEKMEKTQKKKQQSNGRDARTGILTQRNLGDDYNCDTPPKTGKVVRKQGLRHQRKAQSIVRRTHRLPSCSSEPLSPEDNYSSAASTPTTPSVNVVEEQNEVHHHDTPDKSFKFPKFKKGSLNDVSAPNVDVIRSSNTSPETGYTSPSKSSFEARLVEIEAANPAVEGCERLPGLDQAINDCASPRSDQNSSPSPCHSTYASPTRSESVDLSDVGTRHCSASPTASSFASYLLNQRYHRPSCSHTTLKKRWMLKYANETSVDEKSNGIASTNSVKPNNTVRIISPRSFPLPYKRRKLLEYRSNLNNNLALSGTEPGRSQTVNTGTSVSAVMFGSSSTVASRSVSNCMTSVTTSDVRDPLLSCSQNTSPMRRSNGYDEASSGRSSLSSISSTEDIKTELVMSETRMDTESSALVEGNLVSTSKPASNVCSLQNVQERSNEASGNAATRGDEVTVRDTAGQIGSSVDGGVQSGTTAGGKKKVSLSEYLNRKKTSTPARKKESGPVRSSDSSLPNQSRVSEITIVVSSTEPLSSVATHRLPLTGSLGGALVSSARNAGGVLIEPVSPEEGYRVADERPQPRTTSQGLRSSGAVREVKPSGVRESLLSSPMSRPGRPVSEPGSSSDAMDIEEDDAAASGTIYVPVLSVPGARVGTASGLLETSVTKTYLPVQQMKLNSISSAQSAVRQINDSPAPPDPLRRRPDPAPNPRMPSSSIHVLAPPQDFHQY